MPWKPGDASKHTKRATSAAKMRQWSTIANSVLEKTGDEAKAIKIANAAVAKSGSAKSNKSNKKRSKT